MKKSEIRAVLDALKTIDVSKIGDGGLRDKIVMDYLKLAREQREYSASVEDITAIFLSSYAREQEEVFILDQMLSKTTDPSERDNISAKIESHSNYLAAVKKSNDKIRALGNQDVEVELIDGEKFAAEYMKLENFDLGVIETLVPLFSHGNKD